MKSLSLSILIGICLALVPAQASAKAQVVHYSTINAPHPGLRCHVTRIVKPVTIDGVQYTLTTAKVKCPNKPTISTKSLEIIPE